MLLPRSASITAKVQRSAVSVRMCLGEDLRFTLGFPDEPAEEEDKQNDLHGQSIALPSTVHPGTVHPLPIQIPLLFVPPTQKTFFGVAISPTKGYLHPASLYRPADLASM